MQIIEAPRAKTALKRNDVSVKLPTDFIWKLLGNLMHDLARDPLSGSPRVFSAECKKIYDLFHDAVRARDFQKYLKAASEASPRSMLASGGIEYDEFYILYQLGSLLKKYPLPGANTSDPALSTFLSFERECELYNSENYKALLAMSLRHPDYLGIVTEIREDIRKCIGDYPNVQKVFDCAQHGPGTAIGLDSSEGEVTSYYSWLPPYSVSSNCVPYAMSVISSDPRWIGALINAYREKHGIPQHSPINMEMFWNETLIITNYCKYASVPKTALTDRAIAIEPILNVFLQLGVDRIIRARLKRRWGFDLNSQSKNQELALSGSKDNESCTIDLKGASETVTLKIIEFFLPEGWVNLLYDLRSENILINDDMRSLQKISAMGNGFTFALESLIFSALVRCSMRRTKSVGSTAVYGDDIIVPKTAVDYLLTLLSLCGFSINKEKSFIDGPFRESCGADYYSGQNVRPFFLKKVTRTLADLFYIHNSLWKLEENLPWAWDIKFSRTKLWLTKFIPKQLRHIFGPSAESLDTHLFSRKRIHRTAFAKVHPVLLVRARTFNQRTDFFFRKLMVTLKQSPPRNKWEEITMTNTGSAFDVTRRGRTIWYVSVRQVWE